MSTIAQWEIVHKLKVFAHTEKFANLPKFNGPTDKIYIEGNLAIQVPIKEGENREIIDVVNELSNKPGYEYLKSLVENKENNIDWSTLALANKNWDYKSQGLTPAGAALVVIIVTVLTAGTGSAASTSVINATGSASLGAGAQAAVTTLASQVSVSLINNGGDIGKTLKELGSKNSVKGLVASVVTAGLLQQVGTSLGLQPESTLLPDRLMNNFTNTVGSSLVQTAIKGGNLQDNLEAGLLAGLAGALQGELAQQIGGSLDKIDPNVLEYTIHKIAHAAAGCAAAVATKASCEAGAIGAGVGEIVASFLNDGKKELSQVEKNKIVNQSKLIAGVIAAYTGYDVAIASNSAEIAVWNNNLAIRSSCLYE